MKIRSLILLTALSGHLYAQNLQELANTLPIPERMEAGASQLPIPTIEGVEVKLLGADYEEIISGNGLIAPCS